MRSVAKLPGSSMLTVTPSARHLARQRLHPARQCGAQRVGNGEAGEGLDDGGGGDRQDAAEALARMCGSTASVRRIWFSTMVSNWLAPEIGIDLR